MFAAARPPALPNSRHSIFMRDRDSRSASRARASTCRSPTSNWLNDQRAARGSVARSKCTGARVVDPKRHAGEATCDPAALRFQIGLLQCPKPQKTTRLRIAGQRLERIGLDCRKEPPRHCEWHFFLVDLGVDAQRCAARDREHYQAARVCEVENRPLASNGGASAGRPVAPLMNRSSRGVVPGR